ncbi:MAG: hypothetical protein KC493_14940, partial [Bacteriovoracaceae bacterium]|nr:hypothetical protein [Bacteriovoracaceae bacterium]
YTLYKSRISKNVLETISAFCMEAVPVEKGGVTSFLIPHAKGPNSAKKDVELRKAARAWNLANMSKTTEKGKNVANSVWEMCMGKINNVCTEKSVTCSVAKDDKGQCPPGKNTNETKLDFDSFYKTAINDVPFSKYQRPDSSSTSLIGAIGKYIDPNSRVSQRDFNTEASYQATTGSACKVSQYLKGSRQTLKALEKLTNKLDERNSKGGNVIGLDLKVCDGKVNKDGCKAKDSIKEYDSGDKETGIDSLTTMTSKEAVEGSGMKDAQKELADEFKKCKESGDEETCKKFLATNRKEQEAMLAEYEIRSKAMVGKLEKLEKSTGKDEITKYLKEEGYSDEQISSMLENPDKVKKLKTEIKEKYATSRKNLINEMKRKLDGGTTKKDGQIDVKEDAAAIDTIAAELTDKTSRYRDLVHFNNIVSGYLAIGEGEDAKRNTASLFRELEDVDGSDQAAQTAKDGITQAASEAGISDDREDENKDPASLGVDEINEHILDHEIVE